MNDLINAIELKDGKAVTTSLKIAEVFGKQHKNVIDAIRRLDIPSEFNQLNFKPVEYTDAKGERRPMYLVTRDGFTLLAMGFTGKAAMQFKVAFIEQFNAMERVVKAVQSPTPAIPQTFAEALRLAACQSAMCAQQAASCALSSDPARACARLC